MNETENLRPVAKPFGDGDRFTIEPNYSKVRRYAAGNTTGVTRDGWLLRDLWTGSSYRVDTKKDANQRLGMIAFTESAVDWDATTGWTPLGGSLIAGSPSGALEILAVNAEGRSLRTMALIQEQDTPAETRAQIERYLSKIGHKDLPEIRR
jgi:hypothetical protein